MISRVTSALPMELFKLDDSMRSRRFQSSCDSMEWCWSGEGEVGLRAGVNVDLPADTGDKKDLRVNKLSRIPGAAELLECVTLGVGVGDSDGSVLGTNTLKTIRKFRIVAGSEASAPPSRPESADTIVDSVMHSLASSV